MGRGFQGMRGRQEADQSGDPAAQPLPSEGLCCQERRKEKKNGKSTVRKG